MRRYQITLITLGVFTVAFTADPALAFAAGSSAAGTPGAAGSQIMTLLQALAGPLLIGLMAIRGLGHYFSHDYGKALGHFGLGALVAVPIYAGTQLTGFFTHIAHLLTQAA